MSRAASNLGALGGLLLAFVAGRVPGAVFQPPIGPADPRHLWPSARTTSLILSEVMYHPPVSAGAGAEFVEVFNTDPVAQSLTGYQLAGQIQFTFPTNTMIAARGYVVVAADPARVQSLYGLTGVLGPWSNRLDNAGGTVELRSPRGSVLLEARYDDDEPWPAAAEGLGHSLVLSKPDYGEGDARAWQASAAIGGNPGTHDPQLVHPLAGAVFNEILASASAPTVNFVEVVNRSTNTLDLSHCWITDGDLYWFRLTPGTLVEPRGFLEFDQNTLEFPLRNNGGRLALIDSNQITVLDAHKFGAAEPGVSLGRSPDGFGPWRALAMPSGQAPNAPRLRPAVLINEIFYHPPSGQEADEFLELHNPGPAGVAIGGWKLTDGISFTFAPGTSIPSGGYLVVARNRTNLLTRYPELNAASVVGDYEGALADGGETLTLSKPLEATGSNTLYAVVNQVRYGDGGDWGQWADGGGSSLELMDSHSDNTLAMNWAGSDESAKAPWTHLEVTGPMADGLGTFSGRLYVWLLGSGEALIDDIEVRVNNGANLVQDPGFDAGTGWAKWGNHFPSARELAGGFNSAPCYHLRAQSAGKIGSDKLLAMLSPNVPAGANVTMRAKARWLAGEPHVVFMLKGSGLELAGAMTLPPNLGSPGRENSRSVGNAAPALADLEHFPVCPGSNQPVTVTVAAHDPDGVSQLNLLWRIDGTATDNVAIMHDDGTEGDAMAGDGQFSAIIPGQAGGSLVAFTVEASEGSLTNRLPLANPHYRERALVRFGELAQEGDWGVYRIWMRTNDVAAWDIEPNACNQQWPATFVWHRWRAVHGAGIRFRGSAFARPGFGHPITGPAVGYVLKMPDHDLFLGGRSVNLDRMEGDNDLGGTFQRTHLTMALGLAMGVPILHNRYVHLFMNGLRRGRLYSDAQLPDSAYIRAHFPEEDDGYLHESVKYTEYGDTIQPEGERLGPFNFFHKTEGVMRRGLYRPIWERKDHGPADDSYQSLFKLYEAMNAPVDERQVAAFLATVDLDQFTRALGMRHLSGDQDGFGYNDMANGLIYKPVSGKWKNIPWDFDTGWGSRMFSDPLPPLNTMQSIDSKMHSFFLRPPVLRAYYRGLREGIDWLSSSAIPFLDAWNAVLAAPTNGNVGLNGLGLLKTFVNGRAGFARTSFTNANLMPAFAITNNGGVPFETTNYLLTLAGTAPISIEALHLNGSAAKAKVQWADVRSWRLPVGLRPGLNQITVAGHDPHGQIVAQASLEVTYSGAARSPIGSVVINELMIHPTNRLAEFIELHNRSATQEFDLTGMRLNGLSHTLRPGTIISPGGFVVVSRNESVWTETYGITNLLALSGDYDGQLDRDGETITLLLPDEATVVSRVRYEAAAPWPPGSWNGTGWSLQLLDSSQDISQVWNWRAAPPTAGFSNSVSGRARPPVPQIVISELQPNNVQTLADSAGEFEPWVELLNLGPPVSLTDCFLTDDFEVPLKWTFPPGLMLGTGQRLLVWCDAEPTESNPPLELHTNFRLQPAGGTVAFVEVADEFTNVVSYLRYHLIPAGQSFGIYPELAGGYRVTFAQPTPAALNSTQLASSLRINEWMALNQHTLADPTDQNFDDWFELHNNSAEQIDLTGYALTDNLTNANQWRLPPGTVIPARGFLLVWADNDNPGSGLHAGFRLAGEGEELALFSPQGQLVDHVVFASQAADLSEGRLPDGATSIGQLPTPTPGFSNGALGPLADVHDVTVVEGNGGTARFTVTLDRTAPQPVSLLYATVDGTAVGGLDFQPVNGTLVFPAGVTQESIDIPILGDTLFEPDGEFFTLQLTGTGTVFPRRAVGTGLILDDDTALPQIDNPPGPPQTGATDATIRGRLLSAGGTSASVWVYWGMNDGADVAGNWEGVIYAGARAEGPFALALGGLVSDTTYFYRCLASNSVGKAWAPASASFDTLALAGTFTKSIATSSDDAEETQAGRMEILNSLVSADLELVFDPEGAPGRSNQTVGLRFTGLPIPPRANITGASIQFTADETTNQPGTLFIHGEARDNPATFVNVGINISSRPKTTNNVSWAPPLWTGLGESAEAQRTPDLRSIVQEQVDRPGWSPGNAMVFLITGSGRRVADAFDKVGGVPPRLHLEWGAIRPPASWVVRHFGDPPASTSAPAADPDADGSSNLDEYVAGTDPNDSGSALRLRAELSANGALVLSYPTQPASDPDYPGLARFYDLQSRADLGSGRWQGVLHETQVPGTGAVRFHTNSLPASPGFYRLRVRLE